MAVSVRLALDLPRDAGTVTMARRILDQALGTLGVDEDCRGDVGLILTEACANVVKHAQDTDVYQVSADITGTECVIEVSNTGPAVDPTGWLNTEPVPAAAEGGRGLHLIASFADDVILRPGTDGGMALRAVKNLVWQHSLNATPPPPPH